MRKQYIRKGIWLLSGIKRKQKGSFLGAIVEPIVEQAGNQLIGGLVNKIFGRRRRKRKLRFVRRKR